MEADRATRIIAVITVTIFVVLVVLNHLTWPRASDPSALETASRRLFITTLVVVPIMLGASVYLLRLGFRVISSGQWPPPGTRMAMRTRIQRGRRAHRRVPVRLGRALRRCRASRRLRFVSELACRFPGWRVGAAPGGRSATLSASARRKAVARAALDDLRVFEILAEFQRVWVTCRHAAASRRARSRP